MKFGVREICDVVLKAKATQKVGNKVFYPGEPVLYFDTLKSSSMEGAATTVYANGGRGNARLVAWEGERTVTFTMEDALISPEGFMILSGAGLIEASEGKPLYQHVTETVDRNGIEVEDGVITITLSKKPHLPGAKDGVGENFAYVMLKKNDEIITEPLIPMHGENAVETVTIDGVEAYKITIQDVSEGYWMTQNESETDEEHKYLFNKTLPVYDSALIDYYIEVTGNAKQIEITADKFGGNYYLEASTLFRDTNGVDMPAEFIIPNCKIQSNFNFTMASSGDPSTFTFTMDAFPDYTRFDKSKKVLSAIQIIQEAGSQELHRHATPNDYTGVTEGV